MIAQNTPLACLEGIGARFLVHLKRLGIETVKDLVFHFPVRYEDFTQIYPISDLEPGQQATIQGEIEEIDVRRSWRRGVVIVEATVTDETGRIRIVWFNQPYIKNTLRPGRRANFSGKVSLSDGELYLSHPTYELVGAHETRHTARLVPIYPETHGLTSKGIRYLVQPILKNIVSVDDYLPKTILDEHHLPNINEALRAIHFPDTIDAALQAKARFSFEDLFLLQLSNLRQKMALAKERAPQIKTDIGHLKQVLSELPFPLTLSQKRSLWEIIKDLERREPMNRLLQGDVGSGKTAVAALAAALAAIRGAQTAFMAPTEVLARQHFATLKKLFGPVKAMNQPIVALMTASEARVLYADDLEASMKKEELKKKIASGEIQIVVGTHALIAGKVRAKTAAAKPLAFKNLGLVIVDEQHRFGVEQRAALTARAKSARGLLPHFLSMSATPIPRTLMLTVFGDLDISIITELPAGRKNIETRVVPPEERAGAYALIRNEVLKGRQVFVVCPRIERPDLLNTKNAYLEKLKIDTKSVIEEYEKLSTKIFPDLRVAMLHGQMPASAKGRSSSGGKNGASSGKATKESVMKDFEDGKTDILVSTSVIEVGVDVPNASVMMIEGSERFGLAQLYQFRGRVGRGEYQSYCLLTTESKTKNANERLKAIVEAKNGFELAERDLKLRGPGEFLGDKQTGLPDYAMRGLQDLELVRATRAAAVAVLGRDADLAHSPALKAKLAEFRKTIHLE